MTPLPLLPRPNRAEMRFSRRSAGFYSCATPRVQATFCAMNSPHEEESPAQGEPRNGESRSPRNLGDLHKTITMAQIARAAGVSQGAISSLLNDRDYGIRVSEKTRERVFKVCREMGYLPNALRAGGR